MKASMKSLVVMSFITFCMFSAAAVFAQVPSTMTYNGFLMDNGQPANAPADVSFKLFDAENGGNMVWQQNATTIDVNDGRFSARLTNLDASVFNGQARWLEVTINGETLSPRSEVGSMPYSLRAGDAQTIQGKTPEQLGGGGGSGTDTLASLNCNNNQIALFNGGSWACTNMPVYTGSNFATSGQNCPTGQIVSGITADGKVTCVADKDTNTTYTGANFATSNQTCPAGQIVSGISATGTLTCVTDSNTNTTYGAGAGLSLSGTTFSVANGGITNTHLAGSIAPSKITGTAVTLNSNPQFTGTITATNFRHSPAKSIKYTYHPREFKILTTSTHTTGSIVWHNNSTAYSHTSGGGNGSRVTAVTPIERLPTGATLTSYTCYVVDNKSGKQMQVAPWIFRLNPLQTTSFSVVGSYDNYALTTAQANATETSQQAALNFNHTFDENYSYMAAITIRYPYGTDPDLRFKGCSINVAVNQIY